MNPPTQYNWESPQQQARAGLLIIVYKAVITIIRTLWPIVVVLLFRKGSKGFDTFEILLLAVSLLILLRSVIEFFYFRFYIANEELVIKKGLISRKTITIPLERIQAVHIEQTLLHQVLEVVKVKIDTAGTEKTEATIDALQSKKAEHLKAFLLQEKQAAASEPGTRMMPQETPVIRLSAADLLKLGFSANHIQAFFIVLAFAVSLLRNVQDILGDQTIQELEHSSIVNQLMASVPLMVILVLGVSVIVSLARIVLMYFDFNLAETTLGYKLKTGLLNTRQFLVPFSKIQFISWEANWLRRKIGLYTLEFHQVAGNAVKEKQRVKVPVTQNAYIEKLLAHYHSSLQQSAHSVHAIHNIYPLRRMLLAGILPIAIILLIILAINWQVWAWWILLWIPYVFLNAYFFRKNFRLLVAPDAFQVNSGVWGRTTKVVKWYKIQQVIIQQSIYQRRHSLATLKLSTAGGTIHIPYIPLALAQAVQNYALYEVERMERSWM